MLTPPGFDKITGSPFITVRTILLIPACIIVLLAVIYSEHFLQSSPFLLLMPAFYYAFGNYMYYFLVSDSQLLFRNHYFWWVNEPYELINIHTTCLERANGGRFAGLSVALRIVTFDVRSKQYAADSLEEEDWKKLNEIFSRNAIPFSDSTKYP